MNYLKRFSGVASVCVLLHISFNGMVNAQDINKEEPICYFQTANGTKISLVSLCEHSTIKHPSLSLNIQSLKTQSVLAIENVKILSDESGKKPVYYLSGVIKNNGDTSQSNISVNYSLYELVEGNLKIYFRKKVFVDNSFLQPGEKTIFVSEFIDPDETTYLLSKFNREPELLVIDSLDSVESGLTTFNVCYSGSRSGKQLCQRLNPSSIRDIDSETIRR